MSTNSRLAIEVALGVLAIASTSFVLFNVLSASSRQTPERTSGSQRVRRDDPDAQAHENILGFEPLMQPLGLPPPPAYMPPPPPPVIPPIYIITPPMPTYHPAPFIEPRPRAGPPPPPPNPVEPLSTITPAIQRLNDLQLQVHQQQNIFTEQWDDFCPKELSKDNLAFVIYSRSQRTPFVPETLFLLEIVSDALKRVLKECDCLKYVESVFDPTPRIYAHKLFNQITSLRTELEMRRNMMSTPREENAMNANAQIAETSNPTARVTGERPANSVTHAMSPERQMPSVVTNAEPQNVHPNGLEHLRLGVLHLESLLTFLDKEFQPMKQKMDALMSKNTVTFDILWLLFPEGSEVIFKDLSTDLKRAGKITSARYRVTFQTQTFEIVARCIDYNGDTFYYNDVPITIQSFFDVKDIGSLAAQPLSEDDARIKEELISRGETFVALQGMHYLEYEGYIIQQDPKVPTTPLPPPGVIIPVIPPSKPLRFQTNGRVMVDCKSYTKMVPMAWDQIVQQPHKSLVLDNVPQEELHLCPPTVCGYSFSSKKWGRLVADKFSEIKWQENAFHHLVLAPEKKSLIEGLVLAHRDGVISDVISSKFGGFIIILHGKPGTGKTLTAEAAAEMAKKPLFVLSSVELGGQSVELEHNLRNVLEICKMWNAILLIDEAEVYLEARSVGQLERNAMVSTFLRILEYHQQVVFLTTNHVTRLDTAFKSRVSVAIKYPDLDQSAKEEIWTRFLRMAGVKICENETRFEGEASLTKAQITKLAETDMNGRQIKNAIRTAQAMVSFNHEFLSYTLLKDILGTVGDFGDLDGT